MNTEPNDSSGREAPSQQSTSAEKSSSSARLIILLLLLAVVAAAFSYDKFVLLANGNATVDRIVKAAMDGDATKETVHEAAKCEPTATSTVGSYDVEDYKFNRIVPFLGGSPEVSVVYKGDSVLETYPGGMTEDDRRDLEQ